MARRKFDNVRLTTDGTMIRDVSSPRGTYEDTQVHPDTPNKRNKAWLYDILPGTTTGAAAERRKLNSKAISNVRKKVDRRHQGRARPRCGACTKTLSLHSNTLPFASKHIVVTHALMPVADGPSQVRQCETHQ